jgi:exopolysaccharide biosynthesis protein
MRKLISFLWACGVLICFLCPSVLAEETNLLRARHKLYPNYLRIVFDFSKNPVYTSVTTNELLVISVKNALVTNDAWSFVEIDDQITNFLQVLPEGPDLKITLPLVYPVNCKIFKLPSPPRLVIDLGRDFEKIFCRQEIDRGIDLLTIKSGYGGKLSTAHALLIDLNYNQVLPALASKQSKSWIESLSDIFLPWTREHDRPFYLATVSQIAKQNQSRTAINGTYFSAYGYPLGILMTNHELISYPVFDRTALIITEDGGAFIDTLLIKSNFRTEKGYAYNIININAPCPAEGITLYTPLFGEKTCTLANGFEITVVNGVVKQTALGNSVIPRDGYVLSVAGNLAEHLSQNIQVGDKIESALNLVSYNETITSSIKHLVGGGPRLVKKGTPYISKYAEKFKQDIARGRRARSAVGITQDNRLLLVAVEGPQKKKNRKGNTAPQSCGASLEELARTMLFLGAWDAMNLDGGGSSTLVVNDQTINQPSDGRERRVNNAIIVKPR